MKARFFILLVFMSFSMASATIINVPGDSATIQGGINGSIDGDTVLVQPGIYVENIYFNGHNIVLGSLFLTTGDTSYISTTIIDGDSAGSVVTFDSGEDNTAVIKGFKIQNGFGTGTFPEHLGGGIACKTSSNPTVCNNIIIGNFARRGAGIYCDNSEPIIKNNKIADNFAGVRYYSTTYGGAGGGIYCVNSSPTMENNIISGNQILYFGYGGGICCYDNSHPDINYNVIIGNFSDYLGAGIVCVDNSNPGIFGNTISNNINDLGGGGISCLASSPSIIDNYISDNYADGAGGGIHSISGSNPVISGNTVLGNASPVGGGICIADSSTTVINNIISGNSGNTGGGIYTSGGYPSTIISQNLIIDNSAHHGGGIYCHNSFPAIDKNTLYWNFSSNSGGGIYCYDSSPIIFNTILWADSAASGNEIYIESGNPAFTYCDIQDTLWPGEGNISCDPQFCEPDSGNFELNAFSCCVGAGQNGEDIGARGIGCYNCEGYVVGDVNDSGNYNGLDITYGVAYLKGGPPPLYECVCTPGNIWYASGDVNGSCSYNGLDITYGVSFLKGIYTELLPCPDCPPVR
ncbi:MAG: right-handed parallel beta-helix repeat-containing protein [Candidatus Zixiibacteriota bacterium]|nr:MAG: right-handed parallel beta-helix repeat-containing protein [candidate division Zixibacteria bacterium]